MTLFKTKAPKTPGPIKVRVLTDAERIAVSGGMKIIMRTTPSPNPWTGMRL